MTAPSCSGPSAASAAAIARSLPTSCALSTRSVAESRRASTRSVPMYAAPRSKNATLVVVDDQRGRRRARRGRPRRHGAGELLPRRRQHRVRYLLTQLGEWRARHTFGDRAARHRARRRRSWEARDPDAGLARRAAARTRGARPAGGGCRRRRPPAPGTPASATASRSTDRRAGRDRRRARGDASRRRRRIHAVARGTGTGSWRRLRTSKPSCPSASPSSASVGRPPGAPNAMCTAAPATTPRKSPPSTSDARPVPRYTADAATQATTTIPSRRYGRTRYGASAMMSAMAVATLAVRNTGPSPVRTSRVLTDCVSASALMPIAIS